MTLHNFNIHMSGKEIYHYQVLSWLDNPHLKGFDVNVHRLIKD